MTNHYSAPCAGAASLPSVEPEARPPKQALNFYPANGLNPHNGYGRNSIGILHGLMAAGIDVRMCDPNVVPLDAPILVVGYPGRGERLPKHLPKFLYTMSESTRVSEAWVRTINQMYEQVFVPCPALVDVYRESGVRVPVVCAGHTIDQFLPPYTLRTWEPGQQFTFLTYSLGDLRKGAELVMLAFRRLFGGNPLFKLVVKGPDRESWLDGCIDDQVEIVRGEIDEARWHELLAQAHCFVFPSRGEGFGMPPREATIAGLPTIATRWLGMEDVDAWGYGLPVTELRTAHFSEYEANAEGALWAEPDRDALDVWMRWVVEHYGDAVARAWDGRHYLLRNHNIAHVGEILKGLIFDSVTGAPRVSTAAREPLPDMAATSLYAYGPVTLHVRNGEYAGFDRGIVSEVQHGYFWDVLRGREVITIIDVGAHIGAFSLYAKALWPDAQIVAVEAERDNAELLRANLYRTRQRGLAAVWARMGYCEGEFQMAKAHENSGGHIVIPRGAIPDERYHVVELPQDVVTIESIMDGCGWARVNLLKLDCEGCEIDVLQNVSDDALSRIDAIVGERHMTEAAFMELVGGQLAAHFTLSHLPSPVPELGLFLALRREEG